MAPPRRLKRQSAAGPLTMPSLLRLFSAYRELEREAAALRSTATEVAVAKTRFEAWSRFFPPGHFHSPLPSASEVDDALAKKRPEPPFADIPFDPSAQFRWLECLGRHYSSHPFVDTPSPGRRFYLENNSYSSADAMFLFCMLAELRPHRVIEIGSGFSSAAMLDANEFTFQRSIQLTFIDPDMSRLKRLLLPEDERRVTLIEKRIQDVALDVFGTLTSNDVLFVDSSHVSKVGSDVNRIFFDILPVLKPGVFIHLHDIPGDFEYPREWFEQGRAWNEVYLLRAFLMNNIDYRIEILTSWLRGQHAAYINAHLPLCGRPGGGQAWIRKLGCGPDKSEIRPPAEPTVR